MMYRNQSFSIKINDDEIGRQEDLLLSKELPRREGVTAVGSSLLLVVFGEYEDILCVRLSAEGCRKYYLLTHKLFM